jgi:hypothetical protein
MIPRIFHFVFGMAPDFGGKPFSLVHYLAIKSAAELNHPEAAWFHFQYEPSGQWWEAARPLITLNRLKAPDQIMGRSLYHVAHKADVIRLQVLQETGGIYLDLDTISVKPLNDLLDNRFVIGEEMNPGFIPRNARQKLKHNIKKTLGLTKESPPAGLCNAVLLSERNSEFVKRWLETYKDFRSTGRDKYWNEHSVQVPVKLAEKYPGLLTRLHSRAFHYPLYTEGGLRSLFEEAREFPEAYLHHLWESFSWDKYLSLLTEKKIREESSTYNRIARKFL